MTSNDGSNRNDHHHIKEAISFEEGLDLSILYLPWLKNTNLAYLGDDSINYCQDDYG